LQAQGTFSAVNVSPSREGCRQHLFFARTKEPCRGVRERRFAAKKVAGPRDHGRRFFCPFLIVAGAALCVVLSVNAAAQESRERYEAQFQLERDPVIKAKILAKLGRFEVDLARADLKADKDEQSLADLEHYRDQVETTVQALSATGVNAEQHPSGFKELQISLRETLRHIDELILQLPLDKRPWFQAVRSDLGRSQNVLIEALFPSLGEKRSKRGDP
jgi:hypothetical protein